MNSSGFAHILIVLASVILVALSAIGYYVYQNNKSATQPAVSKTSTSSKNGGSSKSGISGYAVLYPSGSTCGVGDSSGATGCTRRYSSAFSFDVIDTKSDRKVRTVASDDKGQFESELDPGTYSIEPIVTDMLTSKPQTVTVEQGKFTKVVITFDTGIR